MEERKYKYYFEGTLYFVLLNDDEKERFENFYGVTLYPQDEQ